MRSLPLHGFCRHRRRRGTDPRPREDPQQHPRSAQGNSDAGHYRPRHQRCGDRDTDSRAKTRSGCAMERQRPLPDCAGAAARADQSRRCRALLHRRWQSEPDPRRARSRAPRALRHHSQSARRQARECQSLDAGRRLPTARPQHSCRVRPNLAGRSGYWPIAIDLARRAAGLCQGRCQCRRRRGGARCPSLGPVAH
jgi:hypothetical protein